jgi:hypothetical protein
MPRPQFSLRSLFVITAVVAVACWVGPPIVRKTCARLWPYTTDLEIPAMQTGPGRKPNLPSIIDNRAALNRADPPKIRPVVGRLAAFGPPATRGTMARMARPRIQFRSKTLR